MVSTQAANTQSISEFVWDTKYRYKKPDGTSEENTIEDTHRRVVNGVFLLDKNEEYRELAYEMMVRGDFIPGGRIHAGAGTDKKVTMINCFVSNTISDSMDTEPGGDGMGIMDSLKNASLTQQMGGGIGMDFSTLRPRGAIVKRTGSISSGPLPFMDMWNSMCTTVMSSGSRRGAMMGNLRCDHPDIQEFIAAKCERGRLTNFNVSVLVTDAFMEAVKNDADWDLVFNIPPATRSPVRLNGADSPYIYKTLKARELWDEIIGNTYNHAEPGVIFIDRINETNNLNYCETISATNPCGEEPLPPYGDCNLGAVNLANMVEDPFGDNPKFDYERLSDTTKLAIRFLDNVIDVSKFPLEEQKKEAESKRRLGLGITGLGNMLQQMKLRYGSSESLALINAVMSELSHSAYEASIDLAKERGSFPAFEKTKFLNSYFIKKLPKYLIDGIKKHGIRNGVLLTIAPTGTTSLYYGNISSGLEPTFSWKYFRKVLNGDGSYKEFDVEDYGHKLYWKKSRRGPMPNYEALPNYMVTALDLNVEDHLNMQAVCQKHIDASISKTINCPESITFDDFKDVYMKAYDSGCKGVTTYRPSKTRGSVLSTESSKEVVKVVNYPDKLPRPDILLGYTSRLKWVDEKYYLTMNYSHDENGNRIPFEVFLGGTAADQNEWITTACVLMSAIFRRGGDVSFLTNELKKIKSTSGFHWVDGRRYDSVPALLGHHLQSFMEKIGYIKAEESQSKVDNGISGDECPDCHLFTFVNQEGCSMCLSCGFSKCG